MLIRMFQRSRVRVEAVGITWFHLESAKISVGCRYTDRLKNGEMGPMAQETLFTDDLFCVSTA